MTPRMPGPPKPLMAYLEEIPDPRVRRTRAHRLQDILVIGLLSILTGGEGFNDMELFGRARYAWLKTFLELPRGIPAHDTFNRVFSALDPRRFLDCFVCWVEGLCPTVPRAAIAIDGKALRRAAQDGGRIPQIVSAWASDVGLVLGQVKVDGKSNEITAIPELLQALYLKGCVVTLDAMGCQKEIAAQIVDRGADYVLALKGNHAIAEEEFRLYFADVTSKATGPLQGGATPTLDTRKTVDKGHGRIEIRRYWQTTDVGWFEGKAQWKNLRSAGMVEATRIVKGKETTERRYFLSSLPLEIHTLSRAIRQHWGIENSLHWTLDVTFREDQSRARTRNAAHNLAILRRLALNIVRNDHSQKISVRQRRILAALDPNYLKTTLGI